MITIPERIDYLVQSHIVSSTHDTPDIIKQWEHVYRQMKQYRMNEKDRSELAFNTVDYITMEDLAYRLFITRSPQMIARLQKRQNVFKKTVKINGNKKGIIYSRYQTHLASFSKDTEIEYSIKITCPRRSSIKKDKLNTEGGRRYELEDLLNENTYITSLDAILFYRIKRLAVNVYNLKKNGLRVLTRTVEAYDKHTNTIRSISAYYIEK